MQLKSLFDKVTHQHGHGNTLSFSKIMEGIVNGLFQDNIDSWIFGRHVSTFL